MRSCARWPRPAGVFHAARRRRCAPAPALRIRTHHPNEARSRRRRFRTAAVALACQQEKQIYNHKQPRVPKGYAHGGEWTRGNYGRLSDVGMPRRSEDGDGEFARRTLADLPRYALMLREDQRPQIVYDPAWSGRPPTQDPVAAGAGVAAGWGLLDWLPGVTAEEVRGWDLYERLSEANTPDRRAVITFRVGEFRRGRVDALEFESVDVLTAEQLKKLCPQAEKVQNLMNAAAKAVREKGNYSGADFGRKVHYKLEELVKAESELESELSFVIDGHKDVSRGKKGSVRPDVKEKKMESDETLCFYDGKTGDARLARKYMRKVARYVLKTHENAKRIIVTQVKPRD